MVVVVVTALTLVVMVVVNWRTIMNNTDRR